MLKFLNWLVTSSENPNNISLFLKGALGTVGSIVLLLAPIFHATVTSDQITSIGDSIIQAILAFAAFVSAMAALVGMIRKIHISGPNPESMKTISPISVQDTEQK